MHIPTYYELQVVFNKNKQLQHVDAVCALQAGIICSRGSGFGSYSLPKALVCSQLPADTTYPLKMTLTLMDSPGEPLAQSQFCCVR